MKYCKYCKSEMPANAKVCANCKKSQGLSTGVKVLIIIGIILFCIGGCVSGCSSSLNKSIEEHKDSYKDINGKTSFKVNETFQNSYEKITLLEVNTDFKGYSQYNTPASGMKYVMAKFEIEAIKEGNDSLYVSSLSFNGFADGQAVDQKYYMSDDYKDITATLSYGKKVVGYVFYEVPANAKNITIDYNADFWTDGTKIEFVIQ